MINEIGRREVDAVVCHEDRTSDFELRPRGFSDFVGQEAVRENLKVYVSAALKRGEPLDHVLLHGPPGLGKTSLARLIANELGTKLTETSGPAIEKIGDLAGILAALPKGGVLFIDEIHRLNVVAEEMLYSAMEDFSIDVILGTGPMARTLKMPIQPFTLIGATTLAAKLSSPLMSRFGIEERFDYYSNESLATIVLRSARILNVQIAAESAAFLAARSRGTPRIANRLLRRAHDFALVHYQSPNITIGVVELALQRMRIDQEGLDQLDNRILSVMRERFNGGPVGIEAISASVGEDRHTIEHVYEPYLVYRGFIRRGSRGRELTKVALDHINRCDNILS